MEKHIQYSASITAALASLFEEDSEAYINPKELENPDNMTDFIHALANVAPTYIYNEFTGDEKNQLHFNHMANQLCFQYMNSEE